ncbi:bifunctional 2-polyprenyl-6-hydroxyphenol methylase/3-demethylubiquinol 3-O-methyltransferase UbiG [Sphingosinicella sp. BN140058]|uniref:class I SAM-dependent methyltransferase n=1 Tax=Sphingosinicella sp. BN140058 TaxID=1892855 RepID=UPI00101042E0|nr:class I SAM-dependent methyltransferase [Sphingosinicella sp. BN140058]QAY77678.1 class I SAM-dependent methyltransferase [Sphingosinicella sp. BN140058]
MELESLGRCPVCGSTDRTLRFDGVADGVFGTPGNWDFWSCGCGILYLDPRPTEASIGEAYALYYTHASSGPPLRWRDDGWRGAIRRGYLNARYGYSFADASLLGALTWRLRRGAVKNLDFMIRHLPSPPRPVCTILDVGCGNGDFLAVAEDLGYRACGLDPDPEAVAVARARGHDVRCASLPGSGVQPASFDHVFMNHVLEHFHDPVAALREARALLVPGGRLWISLPNLGAIGLRRFGPRWRGLEPPRHLALFDAPRLAALLGELGFQRIELLPAEEAALFYFRQSQAIASGTDPNDEADPPGWEDVRSLAVAANRRGRRDPLVAESLTMIASTPLT